MPVWLKTVAHGYYKSLQLLSCFVKDILFQVSTEMNLDTQGAHA